MKEKIQIWMFFFFVSEKEAVENAKPGRFVRKCNVPELQNDKGQLVVSQEMNKEQANKFYSKYLCQDFGW